MDPVVRAGHALVLSTGPKTRQPEVDDATDGDELPIGRPNRWGSALRTSSTTAANASAAARGNLAEHQAQHAQYRRTTATTSWRDPRASPLPRHRAPR